MDMKFFMLCAVASALSSTFPTASRANPQDALNAKITAVVNSDSVVKAVTQSVEGKYELFVRYTSTRLRCPGLLDWKEPFLRR